MRKGVNVLTAAAEEVHRLEKHGFTHNRRSGPFDGLGFCRVENLETPRCPNLFKHAMGRTFTSRLGPGLANHLQNRIEASVGVAKPLEADVCQGIVPRQRWHRTYSEEHAAASGVRY